MRKLICGVMIFFLVTTTFAEKGLYGEISLGRMDSEFSSTWKYTAPGEDFNGSDSASLGSSTAFGFGGGYQFNDYFSIELAYRDYGDITDGFVDEEGYDLRDVIESTSLNLGVKAMYPLAPSVALYGRLGLANWDLDTTSTDSFYPGEQFSTSESGSDIYWAVGAAYSFNESLSLGLEYSILTMAWRTDFSEAEFDIVDVTDTDYEVSGFSLVGKMSF